MPAAPDPRGNFVAEWFGYRVWPPELVDDSEEARRDQPKRLCPFISAATAKETLCIKADRRRGSDPTGLCTVSSDSNGTREDWLACPFRLLDEQFSLLGQAVRTVFKVPEAEAVTLLPISVLADPTRRAEVLRTLRQKIGRVFVFAGGKLGGEVDIPETGESPGFKVDFSVTEATLAVPAAPLPLGFGKVMMFEIQTADFHGSPNHAVAELKEVCPRDQAGSSYHQRFRDEPNRAGHKMEGPNKANIFKRTIYQMLFKMELARDPSFAGFVIILPVSVWTSWLRHLGKPPLKPDADDPKFLRLEKPSDVVAEPREGKGLVKPEPSWIFVFDIRRESERSPKPLEVVYRIATDSASLMHYAFEAAVQKTISTSALKRFRSTLLARISGQWEAGHTPPPRRRRK